MGGGECLQRPSLYSQALPQSPQGRVFTAPQPVQPVATGSLRRSKSSSKSTGRQLSGRECDARAAMPNNLRCHARLQPQGRSGEGRDQICHLHLNSRCAQLVRWHGAKQRHRGRRHPVTHARLLRCFYCILWQKYSATYRPGICTTASPALSSGLV